MRETGRGAPLSSPVGTPIFVFRINKKNLCFERCLIFDIFIISYEENIGFVLRRCRYFFAVFRLFIYFNRFYFNSMLHDGSEVDR